MRIKDITLSWFRGASDPISMVPDAKSQVIYGSNGSGKSSFIDAVEYCLNDGRISHLAHEYSGKRQEKAVPNTHRPKGTNASVSISFSDGSETKIGINEEGSTKRSDSTSAAIRTWDYKRTILRQDEVARFIQDTKGDKYSAILPLLGLHPMEIAAENVRQLAKNIQSLSNLGTIKATLLQAEANRATSFGEMTDEAILAKIEVLHAEYCADKVGEKDRLFLCTDLKGAIKVLVERLSADQRRYLALRSVAETGLKSQVDTVRSATVNFGGAVDPLMEDRLAVLEPTEVLIDKLSGVGEIKCPACGQRIPIEVFRQHVKLELERLGEVRKTFNQRKTAVGNLCDSIRSLKTDLAKPDLKSWRDEAARAELTGCFKYLDAFSVQGLRTNCADKELGEIEEKLLPIIAAAASASVSAPPEVKQLWTDHQLVNAAKDAFEAHSLDSKVAHVEALLSLVSGLEKAVREGIRQRSNAIAQEISADIRDMWAVLHPHEAIENVHLYLPEEADKAIDIGLKFYGKEQNSPRLTLSEGYRNSLGLCIFLAMAKREAANDRPIFLDDVVISLDREHRGMIVELLGKYFVSRQVMILTHDRDWYTELRQQLDSEAWTFRVLLPYETPEIGIRWSDRSETFSDARAQLKKAPHSAANTARTIVNVELALIAESLHIRLPFLRFDRNDRRMAHEFLECIVAEGKRCFQKRVGNEYLPYQEALDALRRADTLLISWANRGSHTFDVTPSEAMTLIDTCEKALQFFRCPSCHKNIWRADDKRSELVQCQCGEVQWRYGKA